MTDDSGVPPPVEVRVPMTHSTILVTPDGKPLYRPIGFAPPTKAK